MGFDPDGRHAVKCDLCSDRRAEGAATTACAAVCPTKAITFGPRDELLKTTEANNREMIKNDPFLLGPATIYLDRIPNKQEKFDAADRNSPKVIDSFTNISIKDTVFPYGHNREDREITRIESGGCNICFNSCTTKFHFKDDKLVKITGNEEDPALQGRVCPKSQISIQLF